MTAVARAPDDQQTRRRVPEYIFGFEGLLGLAVLITAIAVPFRGPLTHRTTTFSPADVGGKFIAYAYDDTSSGGHSSVVINGKLDWTCKLAGGFDARYCGFGLALDPLNTGKGIDFSTYNSINIDLQYDGRAEFLRMTLKNRDAKYAPAGQPPNDKINQATVPVSAGRQRISLKLSDFVVAEWWKDQAKLPPDLSRPEFNNVTSMEFVTGTDAFAGEHHIRVGRITFERTLVSTEAWFGGITIAWMLLIGAFLFHRQTQLKRWKRQLADRTLNSVPEVVWSVDEDGWPDFVSQQWQEHYGGNPRELLGRGWLRVVHPEDRRQAIEKWHHARSAAAPYEAEYRVRLPDGSYRWAVARARPEIDCDGTISRWFGSCTDINDRVLAEHALRTSEQLHRSILEASADCICVLSADGALELMNTPGMRALEISSIEAIRGTHWNALWPGDASASIALAMTRAGKGETVRFRSFCPTTQGTPKWWDVVLTPMFEETGVVTGLLAISRDITSDREKSEQLRWASEHDALTSLPNRRAFQSHLQAASLRAMETGEQIALLLIDLDHFKHVNDSLGHSAGDEVLRAVAERLRESVRDHDFVARVGGDEFAIILEDVQDAEHLLTLSHKVFARVQTPVRIGRRAISAGASIGGALFPQDAQSANDLFKMADTALYALKDSGRGGTMLFHPQMLEEVERAASQLGIARDALNEQSVVPVYQPKVDIHSNEIVGFEALLRWKHPHHGLQLPETVEEAFKDYELAAKIGELMQNSVAADIRSWIDRGLSFGRVSINASPAEFLRDDYGERLLAVLAAHQVPANAIEIEVTEHALLDHGPEFVARALAKIKDAGVHVSLDDFGTGYSSLSHLRDFPVDLVKIDKSFVQQMTQDSEIASIVAAVINLAHSIELEAVAEGVETPAQLDLLRTMGCRLAQGHLFGKPVEEVEVVRLLDARRAAA
jgi:diguanylate cyclase (GGDEF)-like protein/PAS domain S-box-containing protein